MLADGDVVQYKEIKKLGVKEFLFKLDNFVVNLPSVK
jgi:hypothetical protein